MAERCDNCMALEVELGLAKNKINEQAAQLAEYSRCWAGLNSEVETLRMWQAMAAELIAKARIDNEAVELARNVYAETERQLAK